METTKSAINTGVNSLSAVQITKKAFNAALVENTTAQIACCNGKTNRLDDIVKFINTPGTIEALTPEWRSVVKTRSNGVVFSNGSTLDYKASSQYYKVGNVLIVVNASTVEDFNENRERVEKPYYIVMAYLLDIPETPTTPETETNMNTTETTMNTTKTNNVTTAITNELNARKCKSVWNKAVTAYALELVETLDNWDRQPESVADLNGMLLNGASDWSDYSWGGSSLTHNWDISERCCTPSELKRVTNKNGLRDMANAREHWMDVQARALYQAANLICSIARKYFNA